MNVQLEITMNGQKRVDFANALRELADEIETQKDDNCSFNSNHCSVSYDFVDHNHPDKPVNPN